jgi:hypothetical protein
MEQIDIFWLAGYLEAEGSFGKGPPSAPKYSRIVVNSTDLDVVEHVARLFGRTYIHTRSYLEHPDWKLSYQVMTTGKMAVRIMRAIYSMMGARRQSQIAAAIAGFDPNLVPQPTEPLIIEAEFECLWLAGYLEGEGSFLKGPPSELYKLRVQSWTTDEDVAEKVAKLLGTRIRTRYQRPGGNYKTAYPVSLRGRRAAEWMQRLRPLMGQRRQSQIDRALENFDPNRKSHVRGLAHPNSRLNETQVRDIRCRLSDGASITALAREYGLSVSSIRDIRSRRSWGWLED